MIKLNQNYSDYTDETDVDYPEGKAINASSSESFDGTPLLAEFMNDINASHIAMYELAYGNRNGISGEPDTQKNSQFAKAIAKYSDDRLNTHKNQRGLSDGVHGATVAATPGQIACRDAYGNMKVGDALDSADVVNKAYVDNHINKKGTAAHGATVEATANQLAVRDSSGKLFGKTSATGSNPTISKTNELVSFTALYNALFPVGFVYTQYPGEKSPSELKMPGTWNEIKFGGAFFRSEGGNAKPYTDPFSCAVSGDGLAITFFKKPTSSQLVAGDILIFNDQYREVKSYNASSGVAVVTTAFNNPSNINTLIIGQQNSNKSHTHTFNGDTKRGSLTYVWAGNDNASGICTKEKTSIRGINGVGSAGDNYHFTISFTTSGTNSKEGLEESRPNGITIRIWKRIN